MWPELCEHVFWCHPSSTEPPRTQLLQAAASLGEPHEADERLVGSTEDHFRATLSLTEPFREAFPPKLRRHRLVKAADLEKFASSPRVGSASFA